MEIRNSLSLSLSQSFAAARRRNGVRVDVARLAGRRPPAAPPLAVLGRASALRLLPPRPHVRYLLPREDARAPEDRLLLLRRLLAVLRGRRGCRLQRQAGWRAEGGPVRPAEQGAHGRGHARPPQGLPIVSQAGESSTVCCRNSTAL